MTSTPEILATARAMREVLIRYRFTEGKRGWDVLDGGRVIATYRTSTECREWIDCQAFRAGVLAFASKFDNQYAMTAAEVKTIAGPDAESAGGL